MSKLTYLGSVSAETRASQQGVDVDGTCVRLGEGFVLHYKNNIAPLNDPDIDQSEANCTTFI